MIRVVIIINNLFVFVFENASDHSVCIDERKSLHNQRWDKNISSHSSES